MTITNMLPPEVMAYQYSAKSARKLVMGLAVGTATFTTATYWAIKWDAELADLVAVFTGITAFILSVFTIWTLVHMLDMMGKFESSSYQHKYKEWMEEQQRLEEYIKMDDSLRLGWATRDS